MITGAEMVVKALIEEEVDTLFAYPGGQAIDLFHALHGEKKINLIIPRHEQGLIHAADGYARSTGKVGVCLVTSGPGATNLVTGIATANYDSVPLVCFTGQVSTDLMGNNSFQEVDIVSITKSICKYAVTVKRREDLSTIIENAFYIARTGKPGVVVVDLPKDVQCLHGSDVYNKKIESNQNSFVYEDQLKKVAEKLNYAKKPLFLLGGGVNISHAQGEIKKLVEKAGIPVITTIMGKGAIPTTHELYIGNIGIHGGYAANRAVKECDVLVSIGTRFNDRIVWKTDEFAPNATIISIDINENFYSKNICVDIHIVSDAKKAIGNLISLIKPLDIIKWIDKIKTWKNQYPIFMKGDRMTPQKIIEHMNSCFEEAIIATDVGQNQLWATQFLEINQRKKMITSGGLGTMGYGFPAAIGAKIGNPNTPVIVISGDGGMQMNIQEMATAVCYEIPIIICVFNNGYMGNVRQWQEILFNKTYSGTCLRYRKSCIDFCNNPLQSCPEYTPNFIELAKSYGAEGVRVVKESEIDSAFQLAKNTKKVPIIIEFIIEREENVLPFLPPGKALSQMIIESKDSL